MAAATTAVILYFSGTGNTWWCARSLHAELEGRAVACRTVSIETLDAPAAAREVEAADLIGLGWPVYGSDLPEPMKEFIERLLPPGGGLRAGKRLFTFCTQLAFSGDGARVYEHELAARGWAIRWSVHFAMPNNLCVTALPVPFHSEPERASRRLRRTAVRIRRFAAAVTEDRRFDQGRGPLWRGLGWLQRGPYRRWFPRHRDDISVDPQRCTLCRRCLQICPSGNLVETAAGIRTRGVCVLCMRCYNFCPVQAVLYLAKAHNQRRGTPYRGPVRGFRPEDLQ